MDLETVYSLVFAAIGWNAEIDVQEFDPALDHMPYPWPSQKADNPSSIFHSPG